MLIENKPLCDDCRVTMSFDGEDYDAWKQMPDYGNLFLALSQIGVTRVNLLKLHKLSKLDCNYERKMILRKQWTQTFDNNSSVFNETICKGCKPDNDTADSHPPGVDLSNILFLRL